MARLGKRERAIKREIIHGNMANPPQRPTSTDKALGSSSPARLEATNVYARGPRQLAFDYAGRVDNRGGKRKLVIPKPSRFGNV